MVLAAALLGGAAPADDHAILQRAFAPGRAAELESDLYNGKAAVYRPVRVPIWIEAMAGEGCESRLRSGEVARLIDWRSVRRIELGRIGDGARVWIVRAPTEAKLVVTFDDADVATRAVLAMERLQTACRP
ncbi:MAG TPA: hypothetical protein VEA44_14835, partial [Caulobacter sp.]|nr:hypothetical protein [Caulobacter sp.]